MKKQTRFTSLVEFLSGTIIGFVVFFTANTVVLPMYGFPLSTSVNIQLLLVYTIISVIRSYFVRRWWNSEWWCDWCERMDWKLFTWRSK